jgi:hypothetical protein
VNWILKREVVIVLWVLTIMFEAGMAYLALASGVIVWAWILFAIVVALLVMGPRRWMTMFWPEKEKRGWWLYEDL